MAHFGCLLLIVSVGELENQALMRELLVRFNVRKVLVSAYHPQSNGLVKSGHQNIVDALVKLMAPSGIQETGPHISLQLFRQIG